MDYPTWYKRISQPFRTKSRSRLLASADQLLVAVFVASYAVLLAFLMATGDPRVVKAVAVPAAVYVLAAALRIVIGRPRPYETFEIDPLIRKDTQGKSMPSLHVTSATAIACICAWIWLPGGIVLGIGCVGIACTRLIGGVHYPTDIAAAFALGMLVSTLGLLFVS